MLGRKAFGRNCPGAFHGSAAALRGKGAWQPWRGRRGRKPQSGFLRRHYDSTVQGKWEGAVRKRRRNPVEKPGDPSRGDRIRPGAGSRRAPGKPGGGAGERKPLSPAPFRRFASSHAGDAPRNGSPQKSGFLAGARTECRSDQSPMPCCDRRPERRRRLAGGGHAFGTALICRQDPDLTGGCPCASALSGGSRGFPSPPSFRGAKRRGDPDPPVPRSRTAHPPGRIPREGPQLPAGEARGFSAPAGGGASTILWGRLLPEF